MGFTNDEHQKEWYTVLDNKGLYKICIAAPRNHSKTTAFSVNYPLKEVAENPNVRILLVSAAESQSQSFLREITNHIERNETLHELVGNLKPENPDRWTSKEIIVNRTNLNVKDPTISTVGVGGTILSKRADIIVCDDILNPENTKTVEQRRKLRDWFYDVLLPVLEEGGRIIFVGTVWHPEDLLHEILGDPSWDFRKLYRAVIEEPTNEDMWKEWYSIRIEGTPESAQLAKEFLERNYDRMNEGVKLLWPGKFTYASLYVRKRANSVSFEKSYQNNIVSREDQKFKEPWLDAAKSRGVNLRLIKELSVDQRKEFKILTTGIDLASSEKTQGDDIVFLTIGVRRLDEMVQLLNIERGKFSPEETRQMGVDHNSNFRPDKMLVENNGYQNAMKRDMAGENLPVEGFTTTGEKFDPFVGVESMALLFENDRFILPYDKLDPTTIALIDQLVDELRKFPAGHTGDSAMALWFACTAMRSMVPAGQSGFLSLIQQDLQDAAVKANEDKTPEPQNLNAWQQMAQAQR